eukprot:COSAG01_NODE_36789_length_512_cov_2.215496_1_plen_35_part_01
MLPLGPWHGINTLIIVVGHFPPRPFRTYGSSAAIW